jgi:hypothetical protein
VHSTPRGAPEQHSAGPWMPVVNSASVSETNEPGNPEPPLQGSEADTLLGGLERQRSIIAWKCGGLDEVGLRTTTAASTITLGGLLKHLALVEDDYFSDKIGGRGFMPPWTEVDWDADPDWEWRSAADDTAEDLTALWQAACGRSRAVMDDVLTRGGLDQRVPRMSGPNGEHPSLRRVLIDVLEEYARHAGHADIIRESIDGVVGEDPP